MIVLIKNVFLIDGTGKPMMKADVLVKNDKILAVGSFPNYKADRVVLGNESYLCPGFIDVNVSSDKYMTLFSSPLFKDFLSQGITSVVMGQCGFSLAPLLYGSISRFSFWSKTNQININWRKMGEFLNSLNLRGGFGVNIGTLVGHKIIREDILKDPNDFRKLTVNELRVMRSVVFNSLKEGALGVSFGLGEFPFNEIPYHEIRALVDVVKSFSGVFSMHLRNEKEGLEDSVKEVIKLSKENSAKGVISHFRPFIDFEDEYQRALDLIESSISKASIYFDTNPFNSSAVPIGEFLPGMLKNHRREFVLERLEDKVVKDEISKKITGLDLKNSFIINSPEVDFLKGKSLYEFAQNRGLKSNQVIYELMKATKLKALIFYQNLNQELIDKSLFSSRSLISSNSHHFDDNFSGYKPERAYKTFSNFLERADKKGISIEKSIEKISGLPGAIFGIERRGLISSGFFADLVMLSKNLEVSMVMVNGKIVLENGGFVEINKGSGMAITKISG